jgi:hypothetical protein
LIPETLGREPTIIHISSGYIMPGFDLMLYQELFNGMALGFGKDIGIGYFLYDICPPQVYL